MKFSSPTLLIDSSKVEHNIDMMLGKISNKKKFRPHFKTHQSKEIGKIFKRKGISKITVSSVKMASYFADEWDDITIAFPVNINEVKGINVLASKIDLNILVESVFTAEILSQKIIHQIGIFIKLDTGYNRTGLTFDDPKIDDIISVIEGTPNLLFKGFLTHAGHTYNAKGQKAIRDILEYSKNIQGALNRRYKNRFPQMIYSYGDTPSCSIADDLNLFDEIRPGNFVYYDVMQYHIGSCQLNDIAAIVACPVIAKYPERNEIVVYGGGVHLSKEMIEADNGFKLYGYIVKFLRNKHQISGWTEPIPGAYVKSLSQEHGIIQADKRLIDDVDHGDWIGVMPIHSCLAADLLKDSNEII